MKIKEEERYYNGNSVEGATHFYFPKKKTLEAIDLLKEKISSYIDRNWDVWTVSIKDGHVYIHWNRKFLPEEQEKRKEEEKKRKERSKKYDLQLLKSLAKKYGKKIS